MKIRVRDTAAAVDLDTDDSNPAGINQWTKGAHAASEKAHEHSRQAHATTEKSLLSGAHNRAASSHEAAAEHHAFARSFHPYAQREHGDVGGHLAAQRTHLAQAKEHRAEAEKHKESAKVPADVANHAAQATAKANAATKEANAAGHSGKVAAQAHWKAAMEHRSALAAHEAAQEHGGGKAHENAARRHYKAWQSHMHSETVARPGHDASAADALKGPLIKVHASDRGKLIAGCHAVDLVPFESQRERTAEGFIVAPAHIARTGVYLYRAGELGLKGYDKDAIVRVYRPPSEVFNVEAMKSFESKPIADEHPGEDITPENFEKFAAGHVRDLSQNGSYLDAKTVFQKKSAIESLDTGKVELSCGYTFDADMTPGTSPDGQSYQIVQRNIRGNHVAIVDKGRAGPGCRVADREPDMDETSADDSNPTGINQFTKGGGAHAEAAHKASEHANAMSAAMKGRAGTLGQHRQLALAHHAAAEKHAEAGVQHMREAQKLAHGRGPENHAAYTAHVQQQEAHFAAQHEHMKQAEHHYRMGSTDSDGVRATDDRERPTKRRRAMDSDEIQLETVNIGGIKVKVLARDAVAAQDAYDRFAKQHNDACAAHDKLGEAHGKMKDAYDALKGKHDALVTVAKESADAKDAADAKIKELEGKVVSEDALETIIEKRANERTDVIAGAKKLVGDSFADKGKTIAQIRTEAVTHVVANDAALKPIADAGLGGIAADKADTAKIGSVFAVLVAAKGTKVADGARAFGADTNLRMVLAHDGGSDGAAAGTTVAVVDMSDPHSSLRTRQLNGGVLPGQQAGQ